MESSHTLLARAQLMLKMAAATASLRLPAAVPGGPLAREVVVNEAAFMECAARLIEANPEGVRWLNVLAAVIVQKGRTQGVEFDEIIGGIAEATQQAVAAAARVEARQAKAAEAKPSIIKPN